MDRKYISRRLRYWLPKDTGWEKFSCEFWEDSNEVQLMCDTNCYGDVNMAADDFVEMIQEGKIIIDRKYKVVTSEDVVPLYKDVFLVIPFQELVDKDD